MGRSRARIFGAADAVEQPPRRACEMAGAQFVIPRHVGKPSPDTNKRLRLTHTHTHTFASSASFVFVFYHIP